MTRAAHTTLEQLLNRAHLRTAVTDEEPAEARRRRELIAAALRTECPGSWVHINGSVPHGDALTH